VHESVYGLELNLRANFDRAEKVKTVRNNSANEKN
jgi:hypothetical protein